MTAKAFAPAKLNLTLHVTGRRADGYHLLDSLVVFADIGDHLSLAPAATTSLRVTGPMAAGVPTDASNLVLRAAGLMTERTAQITLDKHLPAAAGIGGGSADAAATLRALSALGATLPDQTEILTLGADVPVCLAAQPTRMRGIGQRLDPLAAIPQLAMVLVNPGVAVPTPQIFAGLNDAFGSPMPDVLPVWSDAADFASWLAGQRNDLQPPACAAAPVISDALDAINAQHGCLLARMSGSGATCFGLFETPDRAHQACAALASARPSWWIKSTSTLSAVAGVN